MWITRLIEKPIAEELIKGEKLVVLYGARQTGKTSAILKITNDLPYKALRINADQARYSEIFAGRDLRKMKELTEGYELLFIDEGQKIQDLGIHLKILHDEVPDLRIIVTGSSSFDLATKIAEPLTGRKRVYTLYSFSQEEVGQQYNRFELKERLDEFLLYGTYPEVIAQPGTKAKIEAITEISESYLMKDILELNQVRHAKKAYQMLKMLALQAGSEISLNEISKALQMSHETVETYLTLFERSFVVFQLGGFSRNLRNEISKSCKVFFWDTGIRNYLAANFNSLENRTDAGSIFENFVIAERMKWLNNHRILANSYFWRLYTGSEIDYIEESNGKLTGYEIKWGHGRPRSTRTWTETYQAGVELINRNNYLNFIGL